jgi:hypothetical protein
MGSRLEDAARVTRIAKGYLKALEEDDYDKLPSDAYAKGFLRVYANYLGICEEDVLELYRRGNSPEHTLETDSRSFTPDEISHVASGWRKRWIIYLLLPGVVLSALILYYISKGTSEKTGGHQPTSRPSHAEQLNSPVSQPALSPDELKRKVPEQSANGQMLFSKPPVTDKGSVLRFKTVKDGSLDITIDDMVSQHYDLKVGDIIEWKGHKQFAINLEDAGGVEAELNGRTLEPFGESGAPAHVVLQAGGAESGGGR